jgi:hypothetical protein
MAGRGMSEPQKKPLVKIFEFKHLKLLRMHGRTLCTSFLATLHYKEFFLGISLK